MPLTKVFYYLPMLFMTSCSTVTLESNPELISGDGFIDVEGGRIWYGIMGDGSKTPLLCLHGGPGGTSRSYYHLSEIAEERPVIMFDQLGTGKSDHHRDTSLLKVDKFVEQVKAVKTELQLNDFYLVGSSWGAALALEYYSTYPEGVKGLIFNSPYFSTPIWAEDADILISALPDSIQQAISKAEMDSIFDTKAYTEANTFFLKKHGMRKEFLKIPYDTVASRRNTFIYNHMWGPSEFTATGTLRGFDNHEELKEIKVPTLFTTGEFDEARPETVKKFSQMVPNAKFTMIPGAGHYTLNDNKPVVISTIQEFLVIQD